MDNIEKIKIAVKENGLDALLITGESNRLYATGFAATDGVAVVTPDKAWFMTDSRYIEAAQNTIKSAEVLMVDRQEPYAKRINKILADGGIKRLGFEEEKVTQAEYSEWCVKLTAHLEPAQQILTDLRAVKSGEELNAMIKAQRLAEKCFEEILPLISTDITEKELAAELIYRFLKYGADDKSFDPIIVSGVHSSMPHGVPCGDKITKGFLTVDFGVKLGGWCSDTTRTVCVGKPDEEMVRVYETVLNAQEAGIAAAHGDARGCDIDGAARKVIEQAGYGAYFGHGFGHGVGLDIHELPTASPAYEREIPEGAVISAEPGIYLPGRFGVRIEDVIHLTRTGCENITLLPKKLLIV